MKLLQVLLHQSRGKHATHATPADEQIYSINAHVYHAPDIVRHYRGDTLAREDAVGLLKYQPFFAHKDVLDIGAGTGRTAIYLSPLAHRYQAVDYSPAMVDAFRQALPDVPIALEDMRDLSHFPDVDYDFVLASNNVFDAVGHEDRLQTLREMHRLLRPGGILMFSAHNSQVRDLIHWPRLHWVRNPATDILLALHWVVALGNYARLRKLQEFTDNYALIVDEAHDCALLQYYIGPDAQRRQLEELGFELLETFDRYGVPAAPGARTDHSNFMLYVARRNPVS